MNISDVKNFTKDLEVDNQHNIEAVDSLNNINIDELKQKMNDYLENKSNQLDQNNFDKEDTVKNEIVPNSIEKTNVNNETLRNEGVESRTPLGKIVIENSVMETLSRNGIEKFRDLLNKNLKREKFENFCDKLNDIGKKGFEFVKKHAITLIRVAGKLIRKTKI